jgi:SH3 domain-containing protein
MLLQWFGVPVFELLPFSRCIADGHQAGGIMLRSNIVIVCLALAGAAVGEPVHLDGETIRRDLVGTLLKVDTPLRTQIPIRIGSDGLVSAEAGALASMLGSEKDRGRWWIEHDQLCTKWFRWFEAKTRCLSLQRDGNRIYWQEASGEKGTATLEVAEIASPIADPRPNSPVVSETPASLESPSQPPESESPAPPVAAAADPAQSGPALQFSIMELSAFLPSPQTEMLRLGADVPTPKAATIPRPAVPKQVNSAVRISTAALERHEHSAEPETEISVRVAGVEMGDELNVRNGPSEFHEPLGTIPSDGRGIRIVGDCHGSWCPIHFGHLQGWVNANYLAEDHAGE